MFGYWIKTKLRKYYSKYSLVRFLFGTNTGITGAYLVGTTVEHVDRYNTVSYVSYDGITLHHLNIGVYGSSVPGRPVGIIARGLGLQHTLTHSTLAQYYLWYHNDHLIEVIPPIRGHRVIESSEWMIIWPRFKILNEREAINEINDQLTKLDI